MAVRDYFRKFYLMSWKNYKLQVGNPLQLMFILLCPPAIVCIAVLLRFLIPTRIRTDTIYDPIDLHRCWLEMLEKLERARKVADSHKITRNPFTPDLVIGWAPNDYNVFQMVMEKAQVNFEPMKLVSFQNCAQLRQRMLKDSMFAGICMDGNNFEKYYDLRDENPGNNMFIPPQFDYSIIMPSELRQIDGDFRRANWYTLYPRDPQAITLDRLQQSYEGGFVGYVREGFILMQKHISESFLKTIVHPIIPDIVLRRFPILGSREDPLMDEMEDCLSLLILVGFLFPSLIFVWEIVKEKQTNMRFFLVNMSIGNLVQFLSWYTTVLVCFIISSLFIIVLLKVPWNLQDPVLKQTPWYIILLALVSYSTVAVSYVVMLASFFTDPHTAVRVATIVWIAFNMPNFVLWNSMTETAWAFRYVTYLIPNVVLFAVFQCIIDREPIIHASFESNTHNYNHRKCDLPVYTGIWIFTVTSLIYCGIGLYMDIWRMGERSAKRINKEEARANNVPEDQYQDYTENANNQVRGIDVNSTKIYEVEPSNRLFKLKIKKLCKRFGPKYRPALNFFTWNVYENEVTVLMGHNGCGKSTLLKILAGLIEPSRGSVTVANYDMLTERKAACMELGLALDTKMLITGLTVLDHLRFICRVKGMNSKPDIDGHVSYFMNALQIDHLKNQRLKNLMPRHLVLVSICCAFVGNSSIILIDDIYSDLDNPTKELIWALINEEKSYRTIIVVVNTTTLAENIADRMAIMSNGELKCTGTKPFLKNMYGHGFRLICMKGKNCNIEELIALMNRHLPNLTIESNFGFKVNFILENKDEDQFPGLIDDLEQNMERLDVVSFRIRDTSTEEIFLRFGCDEEDQMGGTLGWQDNPNVLIDKYFATSAEANPNKRESRCGLWCLHLRAVFYKRLIIDLKHWIIILVEILTFLMAALCAFSGAFIYGKHFDLVPLTYNLTQLYDIKAFTEVVNDNNIMREVLANYKDSLYWYDSRVTNLGRSHDGAYALTHSSEFSRTVNMAFDFGATFDDSLITAWFNIIPLHMAPISLNLVHNALARHYLDSEARIDVTLETLPFQSNINVFPPGTQAFGIIMASTICFAFCFITPAYALTGIREQSAYQKQQFLAGARRFSFWAFTIGYDIFMHLMYILVLMFMVACYAHPEHDMVFYMLLLLGIMMAALLKILLTHLIASHCRSPIYGFIFVSLLSCVGFLMFVGSIRNCNEDLPKYLWMFHQYVSVALILKIFRHYESKLYCSDPVVRFTSIKIYNGNSDPDCNKYTNDAHGVVGIFLILTAWIVLIGFLLFISEFHKIGGFAKYLSSKDKIQPTYDRGPTSGSSQAHAKISDDPSALIERQKGSNLSPEERSQQALVAVGLVSQYGKVKVLKGFNLTLAKGECLNIAGLNGSGRTTLLKLMVREAKLKSGQIWIQGHSIRRERSKTYRMVGYCPQCENLPPELTPRQLLYIQALFHGHAKAAADEVTEALIRMLGLYQCSNRSTRLCTAGEERRLYYAFAILTSPQLVCVDGVPAGLDPIGKRVILTVTTIMQSMGCAFLYTSLPVLDAERLCVRPTVLFDGELWTIRSIENENKTYKTGYRLEVRFKRKVNPNLSMSRSTWNRINHFPLSPHRKFSAFMEIKFPTAVLRSEDDTTMVFYFDVASTTFSTILLTIRRDAFEMNIEDYYITRNMTITHFANR
ncbi:hypothetical protein KR059_007516 [Drosophila kikkawai]|nr:hypothetical protein KR059_007516 [Drosophila kikkawai]